MPKGFVPPDNEMAPLALYNDKAQLKWAGKGQIEYDIVNRPGSRRFCPLALPLPIREAETARPPSPENGTRPFSAVATCYVVLSLQLFSAND
jgi:hypothetical protein